MSTKMQTISIRNDADLDRVMDGLPYAVDGTELMSRDDMSIPRVELVQAQSQNVPDHLRHVGEWYNSMTGEFRKEIKAVMLSAAMGRVAFAREFNRDAKAVCASDDGVFARSEYIGTDVFDSDMRQTFHIVGECATCPLAQFGEHGERPMCSKYYAYAMLDAETGLPFVVQMKRTALKVARQINTASRLQGRKRLFILSSREVKAQSGTYYEPVFALGEQTPPDLLNAAYELATAFGNIAVRAQQEQNAQAADDELFPDE